MAARSPLQGKHVVPMVVVQMRLPRRGKGQHKLSVLAPFVWAQSPDWFFFGGGNQTEDVVMRVNNLFWYIWFAIFHLAGQSSGQIPTNTEATAHSFPKKSSDILFQNPTSAICSWAPKLSMFKICSHTSGFRRKCSCWPLLPRIGLCSAAPALELVKFLSYGKYCRSLSENQLWKFELGSKTDYIQGWLPHRRFQDRKLLLAFTSIRHTII